MPLCPAGLKLCEQSGFLGEIYFLCRLQAASPAERMSLLLRGHRSLLQSAHGFYFIFEGGRTIKAILTDTRPAQSTGAHARAHTCSPGRQPRAPALLSHRAGSTQMTSQCPHPPVTRGWSRERVPTPAEPAPAPGPGISRGSAAAGLAGDRQRVLRAAEPTAGDALAARARRAAAEPAPAAPAGPAAAQRAPCPTQDRHPPARRLPGRGWRGHRLLRPSRCRCRAPTEAADASGTSLDEAAVSATGDCRRRGTDRPRHLSC